MKRLYNNKFRWNKVCLENPIKTSIYHICLNLKHFNKCSKKMIFLVLSDSDNYFKNSHIKVEIKIKSSKFEKYSIL
jgi:hypothetical protein